MTEYSPSKTGEYPRIFPSFQNSARCEKDLKDNKDNSRHLGRVEENLVVNNKDNRVFISRNYPSDSCPLEI